MASTRVRRHGRIGHLAAGLLLGLATAAIAPAPASAQDEGLRPPAAREPDSVPVIQTFLVVVILAAAGIAVNLIPSKRGHQD